MVSCDRVIGPVGWPFYVYRGGRCQRSEKIHDAEINQGPLAKEVLDRWVSFQMALSNKRKYRAGEFTVFLQAYEDRFRSSAVIH